MSRQAKVDSKPPTLNMARLDVLSEKIDLQMCHLIHAETMKKFSNDPEAEGNCSDILSMFPATNQLFDNVEIILQPELTALKEQKSFVLQIADSMGLSVNSTQ